MPYQDFRGVTAAALLKLRAPRPGAPLLRRFPRRHCRGPIEARSCPPRRVQPCGDFRGVTAAALLKLVPPQTAISVPAGFPRRHCRGPIEAPPRGSEHSQRRWISAASLPRPY